jgi:GST-like protein
MIGESYSIVDMSVWGWVRALPLIFGPEAWQTYPNVKRLVDEIDAHPAAVRAGALASKYSFKQENDEAARKHMFPQNQRLASRSKA